ncbi:hypothetical protein E2C01_056623 [Portunus trituberculatus]|uniref:Uncharacterized protein n=1 Tax=Portunus trituberculatus TaxID=210409 RepID=A0A5B7GZP5_PORTR|nr:hypothetical protein [Portunus trituberculatus]
MSLIRVAGKPILIDWGRNQPSHLSQPITSSPTRAVPVPHITGPAPSETTPGQATLGTAEDLTELTNNRHKQMADWGGAEHCGVIELTEQDNC